MKQLFLLTLSFCLCTSQFCQTKKVINDVASASDTMSYVKSTAEDYMADILTWKNDSIVGKAKEMYTKLKGKVNGVITSLSIYIMNPPKRSQKEVARAQLNKQLLQLTKDLGEFSTFYVKSDLFIRKGANFSGGIDAVVSVVIEIGVRLYDTIMGIIKAKRQELVDQMKSLCLLKDWKDLQ